MLNIKHLNINIIILIVWILTGSHRIHSPTQPVPWCSGGDPYKLNCNKSIIIIEIEESDHF